MIFLFQYWSAKNAQRWFVISLWKLYNWPIKNFNYIITKYDKFFLRDEYKLFVQGITLDLDNVFIYNRGKTNTSSYCDPNYSNSICFNKGWFVQCVQQSRSSWFCQNHTTQRSELHDHVRLCAIQVENGRGQGDRDVQRL